LKGYLITGSEFVQTVFFTGGSANNFLLTSNADGTGSMNWTTYPPYAPVQPARSPDGGKVAFGSIGEIHVLNINGGGFVNLTNTMVSLQEYKRRHRQLAVGR
jgi:hypothetical protein